MRTFSLLSQPGFHFGPVDILEKRLDVIASLQAVVGEKGVFKDVHDQQGIAARRVPHVVLVDPDIA